MNVTSVLVDLGADCSQVQVAVVNVGRLGLIYILGPDNIPLGHGVQNRKLVTLVKHAKRPHQLEERLRLQRQLLHHQYLQYLHCILFKFLVMIVEDSLSVHNIHEGSQRYPPRLPLPFRFQLSNLPPHPNIGHPGQKGLAKIFGPPQSTNQLVEQAIAQFLRPLKEIRKGTLVQIVKLLQIKRPGLKIDLNLRQISQHSRQLLVPDIVAFVELKHSKGHFGHKLLVDVLFAVRQALQQFSDLVSV